MNKVTKYLREEKEKQAYEFAEREKYYKETMRQLEKVNLKSLGKVEGQFCGRSNL